MADLSNRIPLSGTFELTARCNLGCKMCLVRVDNKRIHELGLHERTAEEWIDMAHQAFDAGTLQLLLTGGEVMLRPDFCQIYEAIAQMGFILTVYTNATMVTDEVMEVFKRYPPHTIGVTMYGACNKTYQKLCGDPKGYDRFIAGIDRLTPLPSLFDIRTTIVKDNLADLPLMQDYVKKRFGDEKILTVSRFVTGAVRGGICHPEECRITPEQNVDLCFPGLQKFRDAVVNGEIAIDRDSMHKLVAHPASPPQGYLFSQCKAGITEYAINWAGRMYACELLTEGFTNPFDDGFPYAWEHLPEQYPEARPVEKCQDCPSAAFCESCAATRKAETGDWFGIPAYVCREATALQQVIKEMTIVNV